MAPGTSAFNEAQPANLTRGDIVELRFETNDSGFLTVTAIGGEKTPRVVVSRRMERLVPYTTPPLRPDENLLRVSFSRQQQATVTPVSADSRNRVQEAAGERAVYVVGEMPAPQVSFTIKLDYK